MGLDPVSFMLGCIGTFFMTIWLVGIHYDNVMKAAINEIYKNYLKALKLLEEKYKNESN